MSSCRIRHHFLIAPILVLLLMVVAPLARATAIGVTFSSLPSAQGWAYISGGTVAPEATAWTVAGGVLSLNTMPYGIGLTGSGTSSFYQQSGVVNNFEPIAISMRARVLQFESDGSSFQGGGFQFGFTQGNTLWAMGITPTQIRNIGGTVLSSAYDNTQYHIYRLEWSPPSTVAYYVDNTLISTNSAGLAQALNRIYFGDATGAANSRADITHYQFLQGGVVKTESSTWGRIKALYQ